MEYTEITSTEDKNCYPEFQVMRKTIIDAREKVVVAVNFAMVATYWTIGKQIYEATNSAGSVYGKKLIKFASQKLTEEFGQGFDERNLRYMRQFYETYTNWNTVRSELSWSHYRLLMRIKEPSKRAYYQQECIECAWSVRQLERQINSFYYERLLVTDENHRTEVKNKINASEQSTDSKFLLKDPYILEFLGLEENKAYLEQDLEQGLIDNLQNFFLELGKGFCFVARQKRITIDGDHYYVDLVFYNHILKCFVIVELKTHKLTYQDIGQLDFYVKYFEENIKTEGDNPTIGLILCSEKNEAMVKYSVLNESTQLFASKYKLYIPTEEELKRELERERFNIEQKLYNPG